jgi:hypothetical protein
LPQGPPTVSRVVLHAVCLARACRPHTANSIPHHRTRVPESQGRTRSVTGDAPPKPKLTPRARASQGIVGEPPQHPRRSSQTTPS